MPQQTFDPIYWASLSADNAKSDHSDHSDHSDNSDHSDISAFSDHSERSEKSEPSDNQQQPPQPRPSSLPDSRLAGLVARQLVSSRTDITAGYANWLRLGFALADGLGEEGRGLYHDLSALNAEYSFEDCDRQYSNCLKSHSGGVTIASFYKMAQDAGVDIKDIFRKENENVKKSFRNFRSLYPHVQNICKKDNSLIINNSNIFGNFCTPPRDLQNLRKLNENIKPENNVQNMENLEIGNLEHLDWCAFLAAIIENADNSEDADKMILSALAILSGMLPNIYGIYGGHVVYPPLYIIFFGPAASRKGEIQSCMQILKPLKNEVRRGYEAEMAQYTELHAQWEAQGGRAALKAQRGPEPKEPKFRSPQIPANSSASAAYLALEANGGKGVMFETEADVLSQSLLSDYGDYSAGLRAAFHHEPIQMNRVRDKLHVEIDEPRLAVCLTCTPGQIPKLFPSFENGLGSRFLFYGLTRRLEWLNPFRKTDKTLDEVMADMGREALELVHEMNALGNSRIQFALSGEQQKRFNHFFSETLQEQFSMLGDGITSFIFRMGLSAFRIAMVLSLLRKFSDRPFGLPMFQKGEQTLLCCEEDFAITLRIMNTLINHTARVYSALVEEISCEDSAKNVIRNSAERGIYESLGDVFTNKDLADLAEKHEKSLRSMYTYVKHFLDNNLVERVKNGLYRKTQQTSTPSRPEPRGEE